METDLKAKVRWFRLQNLALPAPGRFACNKLGAHVETHLHGNMYTWKHVYMETCTRGKHVYMETCTRGNMCTHVRDPSAHGARTCTNL